MGRQVQCVKSWVRSCASGDTLEHLSHEQKTAGTDWKSGNYQKVRAGLRLAYTSIHWPQEIVQTFPLQEPDWSVFGFR